MINTTVEITVINFLLVAGMAIGFYIAIRSSISKTSSEIQQRVRDGLHDENELLRARLTRCEEEHALLKEMVILLVTTLKKTKGIELDINENILTLRDKAGTQVIRKSSSE
jgi:hypothetical protein